MKTTQKSLIESTNIPAKLVRAVVRQLGGWDSFTESASDIASHGIDGGFSGFINYADTVEFTRKNKAEILEFAKQMADDLGEPSTFTLIAAFKCLDTSAEEVAEAIYNPRSENRTEVFNALAWFAGEEVARAYVDLLENA